LWQPNPADRVQDSGLLTCKTHKFSLQAEAAPLRTYEVIIKSMPTGQAWSDHLLF